jgi:hypothetical protein
MDTSVNQLLVIIGLKGLFNEVYSEKIENFGYAVKNPGNCREENQ